MRNGVQKKAYGPAAERHEVLVARAAKRTAGQAIEPWFAAAARVDRQVKGQDGPAGGKAWTTLTGLVAAIAGARLPPAALHG
jgi:hypothetical protein